MKYSKLVPYKFSLRRPFSYNRRFAEWPLKEDFAMFDKILTLFLIELYLGPNIIATI